MPVGDFPGGPVVKTLLPVQGAPVQFLVGELRSHMPRGARPKQTNKKTVPMEKAWHRVPLSSGLGLDFREHTLTGVSQIWL